jgi:hypothetical protein
MHEIEKREKKKKLFACSIMPQLLLTIRLEIESIFKNSFRNFMADVEIEELAMKHMNSLITEILDPKIYYSRLSFMESGKDAIDIKHHMFRRSGATAASAGTASSTPSPSLPNVKNKFYTRSTLVKNLFPMPSEGKVRALFAEPQPSTLPKINRRSVTLGSKILDSSTILESDSRSPLRNPFTKPMKTTESRLKNNTTQNSMHSLFDRSQPSVVGGFDH